MQDIVLLDEDEDEDREIEDEESVSKNDYGISEDDLHLIASV